MNFAPKLLLTLTCLAGSPFARCSQAQTTPMAVDQTAPATSVEQKQAVAQAVLQATAQSAANTSQTTGQEIVERDPKRQNTSQASQASEGGFDAIRSEQRRQAQELLSFLPSEQFNNHISQLQNYIDEQTQATLKANRGAILYALLYKVLDPMPKELLAIILDYEAPKFYQLQGKLDCTLNIRSLQKCTLDIIVPLPDSAFAMGYSDGTLSIDRETGPQGQKKQWQLQTIQAHTTAITAIVDLPFQRIATGSADGELKIWKLQEEKQQYTCTKTLTTGVKIKQMATLTDGNIVILGTKSNEDILGIFDPQTQTYILLDCVNFYLYKMFANDEDIGFVSVLPNGNILYQRQDDLLLLAVNETTNRHEVQPWQGFRTVQYPLHDISCKALYSLPNNTIIMLTSAFNGGLQQIYTWNQTSENPTVVMQSSSTNVAPIDAIAALHDGKIATASNKVIAIYHIKNNKMLCDLLLLAEDTVHHLITLSDGRLLAALKEGKIQIWR